MPIDQLHTLVQASPREVPGRELISAVYNEILHAGFNDHFLAGNGVGPGELVPAVAVRSIEAAITGVLRVAGFDIVDTPRGRP